MLTSDIDLNAYKGKLCCIKLSKTENCPEKTCKGSPIDIKGMTRRGKLSDYLVIDQGLGAMATYKISSIESIDLADSQTGDCGCG